MKVNTKRLITYQSYLNNNETKVSLKQLKLAFILDKKQNRKKDRNIFFLLDFNIYIYFDLV